MDRLVELMATLNLTITDLLSCVCKPGGESCYAESTLRKVINGKGSQRATDAVVEYLEELNIIINGEAATEKDASHIEAILNSSETKEKERTMAKKDLLEFYYSIYEPMLEQLDEWDKAQPFMEWETEATCDAWGRALPAKGTVRRNPGYKVDKDSNTGEWHDLGRKGGAYGEDVTGIHENIYERRSAEIAFSGGACEMNVQSNRTPLMDEQGNFVGYFNMRLPCCTNSDAGRSSYFETAGWYPGLIHHSDQFEFVVEGGKVVKFMSKDIGKVMDFGLVRPGEIANLEASERRKVCRDADFLHERILDRKDNLPAVLKKTLDVAIFIAKTIEANDGDKAVIDFWTVPTPDLDRNGDELKTKSNNAIRLMNRTLKRNFDQTWPHVTPFKCGPVKVYDDENPMKPGVDVETGLSAGGIRMNGRALRAFNETIKKACWASVSAVEVNEFVDAYMDRVITDKIRNVDTQTAYKWLKTKDAFNDFITALETKFGTSYVCPTREANSALFSKFGKELWVAYREEVRKPLEAAYNRVLEIIDGVESDMISVHWDEMGLTPQLASDALSYCRALPQYHEDRFKYDVYRQLNKVAYAA